MVRAHRIDLCHQYTSSGNQHLVAPLTHLRPYEGT